MRGSGSFANFGGGTFIGTLPTSKSGCDGSTKCGDEGGDQSGDRERSESLESHHPREVVSGATTKIDRSGRGGNLLEQPLSQAKPETLTRRG